MIFIFLLLSLPYARAFFDHQSSDTNGVLSICVTKLVEEWKSTIFKKSSVYITLVNIDHNIELAALHKLNGTQFVKRDFLWKTDDISSDAYIYMGRNYKELNIALVEARRDIYWNPAAKFILIIKNLNHETNRISSLLQKHNIFDTTLITKENNDYAIFQYNLTRKGSCKTDERLVFVSLCSEYRDKIKLPQLVKKTDLRGCHFKFITHNLWPFMNFDDDMRVEGIEQKLIILFEHCTGTKIELVEQRILDRYDNILPNYPSVILRRVAQSEFEGALGGYSIQNSSGSLSYTYPLAVDSLVYVLPRAPNLGPWEAVFKKCTYTCILVMSVLVFLYIVTTLLHIFPSKHKDRIRNVFLILGYSLNRSYVRRISSGFPQRLVVLSILSFALIMPYALQAYLYSVSASPVFGYEPESIDELKEYKLILYPEFANKETLKYERECKSRLNCLMQVEHSKNRTLYTILANIYFDTYRLQLGDDHFNLGLYRLDSPYLTVLRTIFLRRGSILQESFHKFLFNMMSAGLLNKHINDLYYVQKIKSKRNHKSRESLKLTDFYSAIVIFVVGNSLSVLVFICEYCISTYKAYLMHSG